MMTDGERITALEVEVRHLREALADTNSKVTAMYELLTQARGAKWAVVAFFSLVGFAGGLATKLFPLLPK